MNNTNRLIMKDGNQLNEMLSAWEETYKKGQLTFWIFLSLKEGRKYVDEIKTFVEEGSGNTMSCESQSLYRTLRKFQHIGVVSFETGEGFRVLTVNIIILQHWELNC